MCNGCSHGFACCAHDGFICDCDCGEFTEEELEEYHHGPFPEDWQDDET